MNWSYWEVKSLFANLHCVVVGGGIVGLSSALHIKRNNPNWNVLVLERNAFSAGASTKNAGFACFGSAGELLDDLKTMSEDEVFRLVNRRYQGLLALRKELGDSAVGYEHVGGTEIFDQTQQEAFEQCLDALPYLNSMLAESIGEKAYVALPVQHQQWQFAGVKSAIFNQYEGTIDTGKMMRNLLLKAQMEGVHVLNGVEVKGLRQGQRSAEIAISDYTISVPVAVVCTNGFAKQLVPELEVLPARNQVLVTEPIEGITWKGAFHMDSGYIYFREIDGRVLLGGFRNRDLAKENTADFGLTDSIQQAQQHFLEQVLFPGRSVKVEYRWSGIMGLGPVKSTIVKQHSENVFVGVRMGGMGVALGSLVGREVAALVTQA
jgi:glycine/D-amino acid oxidase-like deaminating enzyme